MTRDVWGLVGNILAIVVVLTLEGVLFMMGIWAFLVIALQDSDCICSISWTAPTALGIGVVVWEVIGELWKRRKEW